MDRYPVEIAMEAWLEGDHQKTEALLLAAAQAGNGHAAHNLGTLYAAGGIGIVRDVDKSRFWYQRAMETGFEATVASDPEWFKK